MKLILTVCLLGVGTVLFGQTSSTEEVMKNWMLQNFNFKLPDTLDFETMINPKNYVQLLPLEVLELKSYLLTKS